MKKLNIGFAMTGSFCTLEKALCEVEGLREKGHNIIPVMSFNAAEKDTRFGKGAAFVSRIEKIAGRKVICDISDAEPIGPEGLTDVMVVLPCSGNTLAKLANGIYDTPVTLAVKSHLRNERPVVIGVSTNDALSASAKNIGTLLNFRHYYFIPMRQDNPEKKPFSVVCDFSKTYDSILMALEGKQLQPIIF